MSLQVCLVRHAPAGQRGPRWPDDSLRPLTRDGKRKMRAATRGLHGLFEPEVIYTSPLVRARQTAQIIAAAFGKLELRTTQLLAGGENAALLDELSRSGASRVAAVGHEPWISGTLAYALTGDPDGVAAPFRKGAAALLEFDGSGRATLRWFLQPATLRAIGRRSS